MSVEEDTELRDLISKTLENNGVLAKIRAELRASVFLALEEQETNSTPFENKALKEYLKSPQAALGLCIVREFLEYLELDFTLSVYNTETSHGKGYEYCGRNKLIKDLQMKSLNGKKGPLLSHILQIAQDSSSMAADIKERPQSSPVNSKLAGGDTHNTSQDATSVDSPNVSLAPLDRTFTSDGVLVKGILSLALDNKNEAKTKIGSMSQQDTQAVGSKTKENSVPPVKSPISHDGDSPKVSLNSDEKCLKSSSASEAIHATSTDRKQSLEVEAQTKSVKDLKNPMTSLYDLPPLDGLQGKRNFNNASNMNFDGLDLQEEYEEDFHSTDSSGIPDESSKNQRRGQNLGKKHEIHKKDMPLTVKLPKGNLEKETSDKATNSISEDIDDDTNSGIDDLLNSTASTDNNTLDNSISHVRSNFADYIEEI